MTKEEIEQAAQNHADKFKDAGETYYGFIAGAEWAQSKNERLKAELLGNPEQLKAESKLTEYKLLAGEACFETLSKVNDAWPDVEDREWIKIDPNVRNQIPDEDVWTYCIQTGDVDFTPKGDYIPLGTVSHYMRLVKPQPPKQ